MFHLSQGLNPHAWDDIPPQVRPGRHYDHAPITEAIIEVQCELPPEVSLENLAQAVDLTEFENSGPSVQFRGQIGLTEQGITGDTTTEQIGHVFRRSDGRRVIQSRFNGFSYSALPPYESWEVFSTEAWSHWLYYKRTVNPIRATRLGVRYINKIDIPEAAVEIKDYLRTAVDVSPYLPQMTSAYFLQIVVPISRYDANATIISAAVPPQTPNSSSLILDIDTWKIVDINLNRTLDPEEIREQFNVLREAKNYVFEACITDATRGLIS